MKYRIGNIELNTKSEIQKKAKEILYKGELNSNLEGDDLIFMTDFFSQFHHDWEVKKGVGLKAIKRVKEPVYGKYNGFRIERIDKTTTEISYIIGNIQKKNYEREFNQALREVIEPQIIEFRKLAFKDSNIIHCQISGQTINIINSHVDHESPTFKELVKEFISKYEIELTPNLFPKEQQSNKIRY